VEARNEPDGAVAFLVSQASAPARAAPGTPPEGVPRAVSR
jgi:hypothetical protein